MLPDGPDSQKKPWGFNFYTLEAAFEEGCMRLVIWTVIFSASLVVGTIATMNWLYTFGG